MKILFVLPLLFVNFLQAARQLPDYLPSAPSEQKAIADYTVADVVGVVFTSQNKLPNGHPFSGNKTKKDLKVEWPGSTNSNNIDQFLSCLLLTPNIKDEKTVRGNMYWILHEIMNVSDADKVAAIIRVHAAQVDVAKKRKIALLAGEVFPYLIDVNLLALLRDLLDDDFVIMQVRLMSDLPGGGGERTITVRGEVVRLCKKFILSGNMLNYTTVPSDSSQLNKGSRTEAEYCSSVKNWMVSNWSAITAKANEVKMNQNRKYKRPRLRVFDPRVAQ